MTFHSIGRWGSISSFAAILTSCLIAGRPSSAAEMAAHPNIVFILLDNCGQEWLGCYGSKEGCTPEIDKLAAGGLRVENCYTPPVCGPSRIVALTGRYLLRSGFLVHHDAALYRGGGLSPQREVTFARPFREAGYQTVISGKWQINNLYDEPNVLSEHGFDKTLVWPGSINLDKVSGAQMEKFWQAVDASDPEFTSRFINNIESRYWDPVLIRNGKREVHPGKFGPDVLQEYVIEFLRSEHRKPFMLYYPMVLTHGNTFLQPVVPTPLNLDTDRPHQEMYADMVRYADHLVGEVIRELDRTGLRDETIVIVATDNGTEKARVAQTDRGPVRGELYQLTEPGGNVALMVNAPGRVPAGRTLPLADFSDLLPTFCDFANVPLPEDVTLDGKSFADYALGKTDTPPRDWIFNQYGDVRVVRDERYKLYDDGRFFDLQNDFHEEHNLTSPLDASARQARKKLQAALDSLPENSPPPFPLRSQSMFRQRQAQQQQQHGATPSDAKQD